MLQDIMFGRIVWLVVSIISFLGGQIYLFFKILGWGDIWDKFNRKK